MNAHRTFRFVFASLIAALVALSGSLATGADAGDRVYTLFMGADLALEHGKAFHRVEGVKGSDFVIRVDGKPELIPTHMGTARMRIDNGLKLAGTPVALDGLSAERDYTPARDPRRKFSNMAGMSMGTTVAADGSMRSIDNAQLALSTAQASAYTPPEQIAAMESNLASAQGAAAAAFSNPGSDLNSVGVQADRMAVETAEGNYDAMRISFEISSRAPLDEPYVLVIARIHERGEKPDVFRSWIFAQKLDPIGPEPRKIHIKQGGLPVGYELEDYQVRLYDRGLELPTSHSPNSVQLTREEAQQYIMIEYLAAHKADTLPAVPAFGEVPPDLKARIAAGEFADPVFVKVDGDGKPLGTFADRDCTKAAGNPYVESLVANVLFKPALDKGQPVPGVARVQLASLVN